MATVWMRSKLAKMKPKTEPRFGVKSLASDGPGQFRPVQLTTPKPRDPVAVEGHHVQVFEPAMPKRPVPRLGNSEPIRACVVYDLSVASRLIPVRRG